MSCVNPVITQRLVDVARQVQQARHGQRTAIYRAAADELGMSPQTLQRKLKEIRIQGPRKRRADAGHSALSRDEAMLISAYLMETTRQHGKKTAKIERAIEALRANGMILAGKTDPDTGEFKPLSVSAVRRALYAYGLHPDQLNQPTPKVSLVSLHPNHVWQIDPSLCVLYYLRAGEGVSQGLQVMAQDEFYKNKPKNVERIANDRVWRYVITDHTSGTIYVEYVLGAETGQNLANCFINAMQKRGDTDPFHGVPLLVMVDPGSANTGAVFKNLCAALSVTVLVNKPGQPWAKGQVEKSNDLVEREFEQGLKFVAVHSLEELNEYAWRWMRVYNATEIHSRTGRTRYATWLTIKPEQLRLAPSAELCRELAICAPETRVVSPQLEVSYRGKQYDVSNVPGVMVGEKLLITRNPWRDESSAQVVLDDAEGRRVFHVVDAVQFGEYGFRESGAVIGQEYKRHAETPAEKARKQIEQLVMEVDTEAAAESKRKAKALPFGGKLDPYKEITDTQLPSYLPKKGTALDIATPHVEVPPLNLTQVALRLKPVLGDAWTADTYSYLERRYPDGVREDDLPKVAEELRNQAKRPKLRAVGGA